MIRKYWYVWILVFVAGAGYIGMLSERPPAHQAPTAATTVPTSPQEMFITDERGNILLKYTEADGVKLYNELIDATKPDNAKNSYYTEFMKEKISWLYGEMTAKRLRYDLSAYYAQNLDGTTNNARLAAVSYVSKNNDNKAPYVPYLEIYAPRLMMLARVQQKIPDGYNDVVKNTFALIMTYEAALLQHPPEYFFKTRTKQQKIEEESQAWLELDINAIRHLRESGQALDSDWTGIDDMLKSCGDNWHCPKLIHFIEGRGDFAREPR